MEGRIETVFFCGSVIEILPEERLYEWRSITGGGENADMREVRIFFMQAKLSLMAASIFRANFILMLIQSIINTLLHVACMDFIYGSVEEIGGWNREEMLVLICTSMVINQLFRAFVNGNQMRFVEGVADGSFDHMLLRPIGILFQMNTGKVDFSSLMSALCPAIILTVNLGWLDRAISFWSFILYLFLCIMGLAILSAFMVCLLFPGLLFCPGERAEQYLLYPDEHFGETTGAVSATISFGMLSVCRPGNSHRQYSGSCDAGTDRS